MFTDQNTKNVKSIRLFSIPKKYPPLGTLSCTCQNDKPRVYKGGKVALWRHETELRERKAAMYVLGLFVVGLATSTLGAPRAVNINKKEEKI